MNKVTLRVKEEEDKQNEVKHDESEDHAEFEFDLNDAHWDVWEVGYESDGSTATPVFKFKEQEGCAHVKEINSKSDTQMLYIRTVEWNTAKELTTDLDGTGTDDGADERPPSTLLGHNGAHTISLAEVNAQEDEEFLFQKKPQAQWEDALCDAAPTKHRVGNLVITNVSTSNGTSDYFKFDPDSDRQGLRAPKIKFTIDDEGDAHIYRWRVRVRGTNIEEITDSVAYEGLARASEKIEVIINQSPVAAEFSLDAIICESGAYNFEISVREYKSATEANAAVAATKIRSALVEGDYIDKTNLRSSFLFIPHNMPAPYAGKLGHGGRVDFTDELRPIWYLSHYFKDVEVKQSAPVKDVRVDLLPPDLSDPLAQVPLPSEHNVFYFNRVFYTFKPGEWLNNKVWIAVTMAKDVHAKFYRDHKSRSMLAKNDRSNRESKPEVTSVTPAQSSKVLISALYGGGYPSPEQAVLAQAPNQNEDAFAKVRVTAMVKNAMAGDIVTFEVTDPDDASPYAEDTTPETIYDYTDGALNGKLDIAAASDNDQPNNGNDNRDPDKNGRKYAAFQNQCLDSRRVTIGQEGSEKLANGTWKAWTTLNITQRFGGDNYVVNATAEEANLDQSFTEQQQLKDKFKSSGLLVAWKRVYSDFNRSYAMGSYLTAKFPLSSDPNQDTEQKTKVGEVLAQGEDYDVLFVKFTDDFTVGDTLILWDRAESPMETTVIRKDEARSALVVSRVAKSQTMLLGGVMVPQTLPIYSGVRIKGKAELSDEVSREDLHFTYGKVADGSDGGTFVEFSETGGWILPHIKEFRTLEEPFPLLFHWAVSRIRRNQFHMSFYHSRAPVSGVALPDRNNIRDLSGEGMSLVTVTTTPSLLNSGVRSVVERQDKNVMAHEFGHLLGRWGDNHIDYDPASGGHIDGFTEVKDYQGQEFCLLTYLGSRTKIGRFDVDCLYGIRDKEDY